MRYKFFDFVVDSEIDLVDLEPVSHGNPALSVELADGAFNLPGGVAWKDIRRPGSASQASINLAWSFAWLGEDLLLRVPKCGMFYLTNGLRSVSCFPDHATSKSGLGKHLIYNVIPRIFGELGDLVVHASCISLKHGEGILFMGPSGAGKSTLAASMSRRGADFLSDECVLLKNQGNQLVGWVASTCARLWDDSLNNLFGSGHNASLYSRTHDRKKWKYRFGGNEGIPDNLRIRAIFEIVRSEPLNEPDEVVIAPKSGAKLLSSLIDGAFLIDPDKQQTRARRFLAASQVANSCPAFYEITYPRNFDKLAQVGFAIIETVTKQGVSDHRKKAS